MHCADAGGIMCADAASQAREYLPHNRMTMAKDEKNNQEEDKNAFLAWKFSEHFTYKSGQEGHDIRVQW